MMLKRAVVLGVLMASTVVLALPDDTRAPANAGAAAAPAPNTGGLKPRRPYPKFGAQMPAGESRLFVKFRDDFQARVAADQSITSRVVSAGGATAPAEFTAALAQIEGLRLAAGLTFKPAITVPENELVALQNLAASRSGKAQPDLAGMMFVDGPVNVLQGVATQLNSMGVVEYATFQLPRKLGEPRLGGTGACCVPNNGTVTCGITTQANCDSIGGFYLGDASVCPMTCPDYGACCQIDGTCLVDLEANCEGLGGEFKGIGTNCTIPGTCLPVGGGACCRPAGTGTGIVGCTEALSADECEELGGVFSEGAPCPPACPDLGACCVENECFTVVEGDCAVIGGNFRGIGSNCTEDGICDDPDCGNASSGTCYDTHIEIGCEDTDCCETVCAFVEYCCEEDDPLMRGWDDFCVAVANMFCVPVCDIPPAPPCADRCATPFNTSCFEENFTGGCRDGGCCTLVCTMIPACCSDQWDATCVELALMMCVPPTAGPTPNFGAYQGYLRASSYANQPGGPPVGLPSPAPNFPGYRGEGWSLFDNSLLLDDPDVSIPERYSGLYGLGRQLAAPLSEGGYGVGTENGARGLGIKVAVIEWAYYGPEPFVDENDNQQWDPGEAFNDVNGNGSYNSNHEDLDVISEPGQTLILIPDVTSPEHGTACSGLVGALENDFGMTGIAPDAQVYFFPITSVEEGPREMNAWTRALQTLGPGDVITASYGPGAPVYNLNNDAAIRPLFDLGVDLGITICVSAGNDCVNLDGAPDLEDGGVIVVGGVLPGAPWCRWWNNLPVGINGAGSNYHQQAGGSNDVHVSAWATHVASLGYGDLWFPDDDPYTSYSKEFGGTSAASPEIAGLCACIQGLAKQFYGIPLTPGQVRAIVSGGHPQCGGGDIPGFDATVVCGPDINPDEETLEVISYPDGRDNGNTVISQTTGGFDDSPLVDDILVLRGHLRYGNKFSVKGVDNNYLVVESQLTTRNDHPNQPWPANLANYLGNGHVFDVMVIGHSNLAIANGISVTTKVQYPGQSTIWMVELFDFVSKKWTFLGIHTLDGTTSLFPDGDHGYVDALGAAQRFIETGTKRILVRVYATQLGLPPVGITPGSGAYFGRLDWVNIEVSQGFGSVPGSEGGGSGESGG